MIGAQTIKTSPAKRVKWLAKKSFPK